MTYVPECINSATPFIFADDTKRLHIIRSTEDTKKLQVDINSVSNWSITSDLFFNESKFFHLRFHYKTTTDLQTYTINGTPIKSVLQHKDLGVIFSSDFNWSAHYNTITTKAYKTLGLIRRTFKTISINAKKQLYIALVKSQLLYYSQLWRPQLIKDITMLERIQRRATKYILNDYTSSYESRLQLNILPLMFVFELQDLMFLIKSLKSPTDNFNINNYITFASGTTRSRTHHKLVHLRTSTTIQRHFYFNRIVRLYNHLPVIDLSLSINTIKNRLINYFWTHFTHNFNSERACTYHFLCPCYRCSKEPITTNFNKL